MFERLWCLHDAEPRGGPLNMAIDELMLERAASIACPVLRTYRWAGPFVSILATSIESISSRNNFPIDLLDAPFGPAAAQWITGTISLLRSPCPASDPSVGWPAARRYLSNSRLRIRGTLPIGCCRRKRGTLARRIEIAGARAVLCGAGLRRSRWPAAARLWVARSGATRNGVLHQGSIQNMPARIDWPALAPALAAAFGRASEETALDAEWLRRAGALADANTGPASGCASR